MVNWAQKVSVHQQSKFCGNYLNCWLDTAIFKIGVCLPYWICCTRVWTIQEVYLVFFITVQNFIRIIAIV